MTIMPQLKKFLLGQLLGLEKPVYSLDYWLITMESNQQPDEEIYRGSPEQRRFCPCLGAGIRAQGNFWFTNW